MPDAPEAYFELSLMLESLAKNFGAPNANYYFRTFRKKPTREEYRKKVVEFMQHYEQTLESFAGTPGYDSFRNFVRSNMERYAGQVLSGENKEIEKRYSYFMMNEL